MKPIPSSRNQYATGNKEKNTAVAKLSDTELEKHLRVFLKNIITHHHLFPLDMAILEQMRKQQLVLAWLLEVNTKLQKYMSDIKALRGKAVSIGDENSIDLLYFMDLPRPPVFYFEGNILNRFTDMVRIIKSSPFYTEGIGRDLGIDQLK